MNEEITILKLTNQQKANLVVIISRTYHLSKLRIEKTRESREKMVVYLMTSGSSIKLGNRDREILVNLLNESVLYGREVGAYVEIVQALNQPLLDLMDNPIINQNVGNKQKGV